MLLCKYQVKDVLTKGVNIGDYIVDFDVGKVRYF